MKPIPLNIGGMAYLAEEALIDAIELALLVATIEIENLWSPPPNEARQGAKNILKAYLDQVE